MLLRMAFLIPLTTACVDDPTWIGAEGSCADYKRKGFCRNGDVEPSHVDAAAHCCACGKVLLPQACVQLDPNSSTLESYVQLPGTVKMVGCHGKQLKSLVHDPASFGYDPKRTNPMFVALTNLLAELHIAFATLIRHLLYVALCSQTCIIQLATIQEFAHASRQLLNLAFRAQSSALKPLPSLAQRACSGEIGIVWTFRHVLELQSFVRQLDVHTVVQILTMYYMRDSHSAANADFAPHPGYWHATERWEVVEGLLGKLGCLERACRMVEVGVFEGKTSVHLLKAFPKLVLHGVDPYGSFDDMPFADGAIYSIAQRAYASFGSRARLHRNDSKDIAPLLDNLDLVFIDGSHHYPSVVADLAAWGKKASLLCGHDLDLFSGVARAVTEWSAGRRVWVLPGSMWFVNTFQYE